MTERHRGIGEITSWLPTIGRTRYERESRLDARGNRTTYLYDKAGRQIEQRYSDGTWFSFTYDEVGNRKTMVDPTGTTTWTYFRNSGDITQFRNSGDIIRNS